MIPNATSFKKDWNEEVGGTPTPPKRIVELLELYEKDKSEQSLARYYFVDLMVYAARLRRSNLSTGSAVLTKLEKAAAEEFKKAHQQDADLKKLLAGDPLPLKAVPVLLTLYEIKGAPLTDEKVVGKFVKDLQMANFCWGGGNIVFLALNALLPLRLKRTDLQEWLSKSKKLSYVAKDIGDIPDKFTNIEYDFLAKWVSKRPREADVPRNALNVCYVPNYPLRAGSSWPASRDKEVTTPFILIDADGTDSITLAHELGHVMLDDGKHVSDPRNLMIAGTRRKGSGHRVTSGQHYFARTGKVMSL